VGVAPRPFGSEALPPFAVVPDVSFPVAFASVAVVGFAVEPGDAARRLQAMRREHEPPSVGCAKLRALQLQAGPD